MSYIKNLETLSSIELFFIFTIFSCGLLYLHFFLNYSWNKKQLNLLNESEDYNLIGFGFWGMLVCFFTLAPLVTNKESHSFIISVICLLVCVVTSKYFYFKSLRKLLNVFHFDKYYKKLVFIYVGVALVFLYNSFFAGTETLFDTTNPSNSLSVLRNFIIPFDLKLSVKLIFIPNFLFCLIAYFYLILKSYQKKEYLVTIGVSFTLVAIAFTNSYHLLQLEYWMPLNVIADVFELLRLNIAQKGKITSALESHQAKSFQLSTLEESLINLDLEHKVFKHDLANKLFYSDLNLKRVNKLFNKPNVDDVKVKQSIDKAIKAQQMANDFLLQKKEISEIDLEEVIVKNSTLAGLEVRSINLEKEIIKFNNIDLNNLFLNLFKNSKEANATVKAPWIEVELTIDKQERIYHFKVTDCGDFESILNKEKIFDQGFSSKPGSERGLGLYSLRKLIQGYGGDISLVSDQGNTCFKFSFKIPD